MLVASSTESAPSKRGTIPATAAPRSMPFTMSPVTKPTTMIASRLMITNSNGRWPRVDCSTSSPIEMTPTMMPPSTSGTPNSR